jgi:hypothetical protein
MTTTILEPNVIYLAAPVSMFASDLYRELADTYHAEVEPPLVFIDARSEFTSTADWQCRWPALAPRIAILLCLVAADGSIGKGCFTEMVDVLRYGGSVWVVGPGRHYRSLCAGVDELKFSPPSEDDWQHYTVVAFRNEPRCPCGCGESALPDEWRHRIARAEERYGC